MNIDSELRQDDSYLEVTVLIDEDVAWFLGSNFLRTRRLMIQKSHQVSVDYTGRMYILESTLFGDKARWKA
jgi:hypothetical protein